MGTVFPEERGNYVYCPYKMLHACYQTIILMRANREQCGVSNRGALVHGGKGAPAKHF